MDKTVKILYCLILECHKVSLGKKKLIKDNSEHSPFIEAWEL
jgi:hypothetical protein